MLNIGKKQCQFYQNNKQIIEKMEKSLTPKDMQISGTFQTLISRRPFVFFHVFWPSFVESYSKLKMYFMKSSPYIIYTWTSIKRLGIFPFRLVYLWKRVQFFFNRYFVQYVQLYNGGVWESINSNFRFA
jgi:hypothetical protein